MQGATTAPGTFLSDPFAECWARMIFSVRATHPLRLAAGREFKITAWQKTMHW